MVKGTSNTKSPITIFGVRHWRGMEERQEGTLMMTEVLFERLEIGSPDVASTGWLYSLSPSPQ